MVAYDGQTSVKVYTVNGAASSSSSSLPDWLTRKRVAKKGKRAIKEHVEGTIDLIQEFEFPEASNRIKTTRDGHHAVATGTYKPQMRVYDLDQLTLKFERHTDAENVDFIILSDDWTKTLHLQSDRSIELHTQGGFHYRTRIPHFGRAIAYHFPSCDALVGASGAEVYRLNLEQGRFLNPLVLEGEGGEQVAGVNAIDINPAHQLLAFGVDGNGTVEFWDPRSRARVGILRLPEHQLMSNGLSAAPLPPGVDDASMKNLSVTAISSRTDGLSYAVGTSTGHTLLYDIRSRRPFAVKDMGYGLPVRNVSWIEGGNRVAGDGMVLSSDKKVIKIWDRNNPSGNFASITPAYDINDVHHVPGSGLLMLANEGIQMTSYYIPQLGPAPRWCSFLDNITEEMEDQTVRSVYEDFKFVEKAELSKLGLDNLIGTSALKPYMHGYFMSLRLYDTARVIANPFAYEEHREKMLKEKMDKLAESRIRSRKEANVPKINRVLAERIKKEEERAKKLEQKKQERRKARAVEAGEDATIGKEAGGEVEDEKPAAKANLLNDPRFAALFEDPDFQVDEGSHEFGLLNPSVAAQRKKTKTAVEEEEEESEQHSSSSEESESEAAGSEEDSSDAGDLDQYDPRAMAPNIPPPVQRAVPRKPTKELRMVSAAPEIGNKGSRSKLSKDSTFGQRRQHEFGSKHRFKSTAGVDSVVDGAMEMSWVPSSKSASSAHHVVDPQDMLVPGGRGKPRKDKNKRSETFGLGLERGGPSAREEIDLPESERHGRTRRRSNVRSGSKNTFRGF